MQLVRLVANLSVHPEVGPKVAADEDVVNYLMMTLGRFCLAIRAVLLTPAPWFKQVSGKKGSVD